jgi:DNA-binding PadR family transcriptional regulator
VNSKPFLPLAPHVFEILLALSQGPRHGYGILSEIRERTEGEVDLGTSSLYATIRRLLADGLVTDASRHPDEQSAGPPRRYYRLTNLGAEVVRAEALRLRRTASAAERLLGDVPAGGSRS